MKIEEFSEVNKLIFDFKPYYIYSNKISPQYKNLIVSSKIKNDIFNELVARYYNDMRITHLCIDRYFYVSGGIPENLPSIELIQKINSEFGTRIYIKNERIWFETTKEEEE